MLLDSKTYNLQSSLASFCRSGDTSKLTGVNEERAGHYRRLVFNVVLDSLTSAYPLTQQLLGDETWKGLVNLFFINHNCSSPQVWKMPGELIGYVEESDLDLKDKYPFLMELLLFEWLEIECFMQPDKRVFIASKKDNGGEIVLNPESGLYHFKYPVHLMNAHDIKAFHQGNYFLAIHRHPESKKVMFTDLSPAFALMVDILSRTPLSKVDLIEEVLNALQLKETTATLKQIDEFIDNSTKTGLFLGYKK